MKTQSFICYAALFGLVANLLTGCFSVKETATLADGSTTTTRAYSFWSESAAENLQSSKDLSSDSYTRKTGVDGIDSKADTKFVDKLITAAVAKDSGPDIDLVELAKAMNQPQLTESSIGKIIEEKLAELLPADD